MRTSLFKQLIRMLALAASVAPIAGCGVLAAPCRVASAVIKIVPVVGHAAALPTDTCAAVIDP
jgi:hypothetical protein